MLLCVIVAAMICFSPRTEAAIQTVIDFENIPVATGNRADFEEPLVINQDGLEMTISHEFGVTFSVNVRTSAPWVARYDSKALSMFNQADGNMEPGAFIFDFNLPISMITMDMGDFGADEDSLSIKAYDGLGGTGNELAMDTGFVPGIGGFMFDTVSVSSTKGIRSVRVIGGEEPGTPNSVFIDNIAIVSAIPEPGGVAFLAFLAVGAAVVSRHRGRRTPVA